MENNVEKLKFHRNGCRCPFHPYQLGSYILFLGKILIFFLVIPICVMDFSLWVVLLFVLLFIMVSLLIVYYTIKATSIDPTDEVVYLERNKLANK